MVSDDSPIDQFFTMQEQRIMVRQASFRADDEDGWPSWLRERDFVEDDDRDEIEDLPAEDLRLLTNRLRKKSQRKLGGEANTMRPGT